MASCRIILIESDNATEAAAALLDALTKSAPTHSAFSIHNSALSPTPPILLAPVGTRGRNLRTGHMLTCDQRPGWTGSYQDAAVIIKGSWQSVNQAVKENRPCKGYRFRIVGTQNPNNPTVQKPNAAAAQAFSALLDRRMNGKPHAPTPQTPDPIPPTPTGKIYVRCKNCQWKIERENFIAGYCVACRHYAWEEVRL